MSRERGFSLLELMVAMAIMMMVVGSVFTLLNPAQGSFAMEPEVADLQQRLRVAQDTLYKDLVMAGAGAYLGEQTGSLIYYFPPVLPFRQGDALYIPGGLWHAVSNTGDEDAVMVFGFPHPDYPPTERRG